MSRAAPRFVAVDAAPRPGSSDPTGTLRLRQRWTRDLDRRWHALSRMLPAAVTVRINPVDMIQHSALTGQDPIHAFQGWLDEALRQIVLGVNGSWVLPYVREATDAGAAHARIVTKKPDAQQPQDRTNILQSLAITELQGVTEAVSQQVARTFSAGVLSKLSLPEISRQMRAVVDKVGIQRGHLLINFMTVRAFNAAALDGYRARGITRVGLVPERIPPVARAVKDADFSGMVNVLTAEDNDVCDECQGIADDGPYYIDEAESLIPAHPGCRCAFEPADASEADDLGDAGEFDKDKHLQDNLRKFTEDGGPDDEERDDHGRWTGGGTHDLSDPSLVAVPMSKNHPEFSKGVVAEHIRLGYEPSAVDVPVSKLRATQMELSAPEEDTSDKGAPFPKYVNKPVVERENGTGFLHIVDGHNRISAAVRSGAKTVKVNLFEEADLDKSTLDALRKKYVKDSITHIAAGVMIVADNTGRTLFLRRSQNGDQGGTWAFPAGAVEPGETPQQAAARETLEETGYDPSSDLEQAHRAHTNDVDFTTYMHSADVEFRPMLDNEHDAYKWANVENAPEPLHPGVARTLDEMNSALRTRDGAPDQPRDPSGRWSMGNGAPTHETGYVYHATSHERLHDVIASGQLEMHSPNYGDSQNNEPQTSWPDGSAEPRSYWASTPGRAEPFYPEGRPALVRAKKTNVDAQQERGTGDLYVTKDIPARHLDYWTGQSWQSVNYGDTV